jgi:hypothetical protein
VLGLLSGGLGATLDALPAAAALTAVTGVTFVGSSQVAGATNTTWQVNFTTNPTGTALAPGDHIFVTFPAGFGIPATPTVALLGFTGCTAASSASTVGTTVTITLGAGCTLAAGTSAAVEIEPITNPAAGTYSKTLFDVSTTKDPIPANSTNDVTIFPATTPPVTGLSGVTFSGSSMSGGATNTTWTVGFTTSDPNGELVPGNSISVTFPAGFAIPPNPTVTLGLTFVGCTANPAATAVTVGTTVIITLGAGCTLAHSTSATVTIAGITNPTAGTYAHTSFLVSTSADTAASSAADVVITGTTITNTCSPGTGNAAFLCLVYEDLLGRAPDAGGLATFEGLLAAGVSRAQVAYDIATSPEFRSNFVRFIYAYFLGRQVDPGGLASWVGALNAGWSDQQVLEGIMGSPEFYAHAGGTPSGFVTALYADLLGRGPDPGGLAAWVGVVNAGASRGAVVAFFLNSGEYETKFVESEYANFLHRAADPGGLATWVGALAGGASYEWVIAGIMGSPEFYALSQ